MARKLELGLKYFPHDTDMAYDRNIRKITKSFGVVGYGIITRIFECIYQQGHYVMFSDEFVFDVLDSLNMNAGEEQIIRDVVNMSVEIGLFDKDMFSFYSVLTSHGIQERYFFAKEQSISRSIKNNSAPEYQYMLVDLKQLFSKHYNPNQIELSFPEEQREETKPKQVAQAPIIPMNVQEEKIVKSVESKQNDMKRRDEAFRESLKPFIETYGRDMLNEFYLYWSEPNKSRTKMRFETQPTWDVARRLGTWSKNNYNHNHNHAANKPNSTESLISSLAAISASRRQSEGTCITPGLPE